jgi:Lon protease-like protein
MLLPSPLALAFAGPVSIHPNALTQHCRCSHVVASVREWLAISEERRLGLLPFLIDEVLLPGETKEVHLFEARFLTLFSDAAGKHQNCLGQLLLTPRGNAASISPLLVVEQSRRREVGVWARLKCVGRVRLSEIRNTDFDFTQATVHPLFDASEGPSWTLEERCAEGDEGDDDLAARVHSAYDSCYELQRKLWQKGPPREGQGQGVGLALTGKERAESSDEVEWGHESRGREAGVREPLATALARYRDALCSQGDDTPPAASFLDVVRHSWGVADERAAERQLLSFVAVASLSPAQRAQAVGLRSTQERLHLGLRGSCTSRNDWPPCPLCMH